MAERTPLAGEEAPARAVAPVAPPHDRDRIDWEAAAHSPEFRELVHRKRAFVVPATIFFLAWYFGFIVLAGVAPDFMGERLFAGFTVGYAFALSQFVMVWVLAAWYLRRADREFDPLAERAAARAVEGDGDGAGDREGSAPRGLAGDGHGAGVSR